MRRKIFEIVERWHVRDPRVLIAPLVVFLLVFFAIPIVYTIRMSLHAPSPTQAFDPGFTLQNYRYLVESGFIWGITRFTFRMAIVTTVTTIIISLPYAYAIWRTRSNLIRNMLLFGVILTLLVTLVVKLYAWLVLLSPRGIFNQALLTTGAISEPLQFINNELGVLIGLVYTSFPYAVLAIYVVLTSVDPRIMDAAYDLGATRWRAFREVIIPTALPGIIVASVLTFAWSIGAYASPALLGSSSEHTFAIEVETLLISQFNWPRGAALSIIILVVVALSVVSILVLASRIEGGDSIA